jgi:hypothetical protein
MNQCNLLHFAPDKQKIILKYNYSNPSIRLELKRREKLAYNSLLNQNAVSEAYFKIANKESSLLDLYEEEHELLKILSD